MLIHLAIKIQTFFLFYNNAKHFKQLLFVTTQELQEQSNNLFQLIESWDSNNLQLAFQLIKKNSALQKAVEERYMPLITFVGGKSLQVLKTLAQKFEDRKLYKKEWNPSPDTLAVLQTLPVKELDLYRYQVETLPEWFGYLSQVQKIVLAKNELTTLPDSIGKMIHLKDLNLRDNKLTTFPESIGNLKNLEELSLSSNALTALPESFGHLQKLKILHIAQIPVPILPESMGQLQQLEWLSITIYNDNPLMLPASMQHLHELKTLILRNIGLQQLPDWIVNLPNLVDLRCVVSNLQQLPSNIGEMTQLKNLNLRDNPLHELPPSITKLTNLEELIVDKCPIGIKNGANELHGQKNIQAFFKKIGLGMFFF